jgi:hypothetical protein
MLDIPVPPIAQADAASVARFRHPQDMMGLLRLRLPLSAYIGGANSPKGLFRLCTDAGRQLTVAKRSNEVFASGSIGQFRKSPVLNIHFRGENRI